MTIFNNKQTSGRDIHEWQLSLQSGNKPAHNRFLLTVRRGVINLSTEETKWSSSTTLIPWPCLGIGTVITLGVSGGSNSISFVSIRPNSRLYRAPGFQNDRHIERLGCSEEKQYWGSWELLLKLPDWSSEGVTKLETWSC